MDIHVEADTGTVIRRLNELQYKKLAKKGDIRKMIRDAMKPVKRSVTVAVKSRYSSDPRKAYQGVKLRTYRDANGALIGLLDNGAARKMVVWRPKRGGASGIRRRRSKSDDTKRRESYVGRDRAFILRFLNQGTSARITQYGNRGSISAGKFFNVEQSMRAASRTLSVRIQSLIKEVYER